MGIGRIVLVTTIDHVHIVVWVPPTASISDFVGTVKVCHLKEKPVGVIIIDKMIPCW